MEEWMTCREAVEKLISLWKPEKNVEKISLSNAAGRICAADMKSGTTLPVVRSAQADGIAVCKADLAGGTSGWKLGKQYVWADTGDDFPEPYDTVIAVEDIRRTEDTLEILQAEPVQTGQMVSPRGSMLKEGELLAQQGQKLTALQCGLLAAGGYTAVPVYCRPRVAFIPTGSELILPGQMPKRGQNIDSNSILVENLLRQWGAEPVVYPIISDIQSDLEQCFVRAIREADIVMINGGSSKGSEDYNRTILENRADWYQHGVRAIPGIPASLGIVKGKPVFNLPGPPFATFTAMSWGLKPLLEHMTGYPLCMRQMEVHLTERIEKPKPFEFFVRFEVNESTGEAKPYGMQSRNADVMGRSNAYAAIPAGVERLEAGDTLVVTLLN